MAKREREEKVAKSLADMQSEGAEERAPENTETGQRRWSSQELFGSEREILITHGEDVYRLRKTRHGKLILHK